jgi:hypothetical protein
VPWRFSDACRYANTCVATPASQKPAQNRTLRPHNLRGIARDSGFMY